MPQTWAKTSERVINPSLHHPYSPGESDEHATKRQRDSTGRTVLERLDAVTVRLQPAKNTVERTATLPSYRVHAIHTHNHTATEIACHHQFLFLKPTDTGYTRRWPIRFPQIKAAQSTRPATQGRTDRPAKMNTTLLHPV